MTRKTNTAWRWFLRYAAFVVVLMLPVFLAALYARPSADDFGYAMNTRAVVMQGGSLAELLAAAWQTDLQFFNSWQGLYSSAFLLAFQPGIFGGRWYGLTTVFIVAVLFLCLWGALALVGRHAAPGQKLWPPALALLFTYAFVQGMPNPVEGLYWFNGAANYIPFFALTVLNAGLLVRQLATRRPWAAAVGSALLSAVISGGHHVAALLNMMLLLLAVLASLRQRRGWPLLPFGVGLAGLLVNLTSPGTRVRVDGFHSASMPEAIVKSFVLAALELIRWLDVPLLCLLALLTPLALRLAREKALPDAVFRRPWLPPLVTFLLMWGMLWLPSYTMGGIGAGRLINVVWMTFVLGVSLSWCLLLGWLVRLRGAALERWLPQKHLPLVAAALLVCIGCIGSHTVKEGMDNHFATSLEALYELGEGTPQRFAAAMDEREALLLDPAAEDVTIRPLTEEERPYLLYFSDVTPGPDQWGLAQYYGKRTVTIE